MAAGLRVPKPLGDFLTLADIYASGGQAALAIFNFLPRQRHPPVCFNTTTKDMVIGW